MSRNPLHSRYSLVLIVVLALFCFSALFFFQGVGAFDFWWWMSANLALLIGISALLFQGYLRNAAEDFKSHIHKKFFWGLVSAVLLYLVFLTGNFFSSLLFSGASAQISGIYDFRGTASGIRIFTLMLLIIGPGEELFWRGFLQEQLMRRYKPEYGFLLSTFLYTLVHMFTGNFMLVMAAFVAGSFWGWMYYKYRSIATNVISHVVWDIAIFLIIPIG